jgi:hypothetical protein
MTWKDTKKEIYYLYMRLQIVLNKRESYTGTVSNKRYMSPRKIDDDEHAKTRAPIQAV